MIDIELTENVVSMREKVQKAIVDIISICLEDGTITEEKASEMAQFVLDKLPDNISYQEFIQVLPKLDDEYPEFSKVIVPIMEQVEVKHKAVKDGQISELLKTGEIDKALNLTNQAIEEEKNLS